MLATDARGLLDGIRQEVARRTGSRRLDRVEEQLTESRRAGRDGEADDDDEPLHEDERDREGEAARVARPVGGAKPDDRVLQQREPTGRGERLARVVARELPRLPDVRGGAHDVGSAGTRTVSAPGFTLTLSRLTSLRSPPSIS